MSHWFIVPVGGGRRLAGMRKESRSAESSHLCSILLISIVSEHREFWINFLNERKKRKIEITNQRGPKHLSNIRRLRIIRVVALEEIFISLRSSRWTRLFIYSFINSFIRLNALKTSVKHTVRPQKVLYMKTCAAVFVVARPTISPSPPSLINFSWKPGMLQPRSNKYAWAT